LELEEKAAKITVRLLRPIRERIERIVREFLERGLSPEEIIKKLGGKIKF